MRVGVAQAEGFTLQHLHSTKQVRAECGREFGLIGQEQINHMSIFDIGPLDAINQRTALEGDFAGVIGHLVIGAHASYRHRQIETDHVAWTAYSWFRQLPAGVPGAFRIVANLLSAGKVLP